MRVDPASEWPLSAQLAQLLRMAIQTAGLAPGARVPAEHELARDQRVSRATANRALDVLAAEGLIVRRRGVGSVVAASGAVFELHPPPRDAGLGPAAHHRRARGRSRRVVGARAGRGGARVTRAALRR